MSAFRIFDTIKRSPCCGAFIRVREELSKDGWWVIVRKYCIKCRKEVT